MFNSFCLISLGTQTVKMIVNYKHDTTGEL